jgi:2-amino-4-hydroxy-6-hydroxymethyldihydropteridine diphosphokinase
MCSWPGDRSRVGLGKLRVMLPKRKNENVKTHFVAIGANLPGPRGLPPIQICNMAIAAIAALPAVSFLIRSPWYSTGPIPASDQPRYLNGMVRFEAALAPETLLAALQGIEAAFGRVRGEANAARSLDLDIVDSAGLIRNGPGLVLPHPRAHLRAFVLRPLRDVAPDWVHPIQGIPINALITALPPQDIRLA